MGRAILINDNSGTVISVSKDKTSIKILLNKGGTVTARNEGFEKGEKVCFILNAMKNKIIKVMPKLAADITVLIGSDPILRASIEEQPDDIEEDFDEYKFYNEEIILEEEDYECGSKATGKGNEREREAKFIISDGS